MNIMRKFLIPLIFTLGCANVDAGIATANAGLASADVGVQSWAREYADAVRELRMYCASRNDPHACEVLHEVDDDSIRLRIVKLQAMSSAYNGAALNLAAMRENWRELLPLLQGTIDAAELARRGQL